MLTSAKFRAPWYQMMYFLKLHVCVYIPNFRFLAHTQTQTQTQTQTHTHTISKRTTKKPTQIRVKDPLQITGSVSLCSNQIFTISWQGMAGAHTEESARHHNTFKWEQNVFNPSPKWKLSLVKKRNNVFQSKVNESLFAKIKLELGRVYRQPSKK